MTSERTQTNGAANLRSWFARYHIDAPLLGILIITSALGLLILYSANDEQMNLVYDQLEHLCIGFAVMIAVAQIPPDWLRSIGPPLYALSGFLLVLVLLVGSSSNGATRWLVLGPFSLQPSQLMEIAVPLTIAGLLYQRPLPPRLGSVALAFVLILAPSVLVAKQPDLGTALMIAMSGLVVVYLSGMRWRFIFSLLLLLLALTPLVWMHMHGYQRQRVLTFLNPGLDPLGAGYHIIQSKIAIGSGGLFGKGWFQGTQAKFDFLPASSTDFIFSVYAEETGLLGCLLLIVLYCLLLLRGLWIALKGQNGFQRMLAGSLSLTFFLYVIVNMGMVVGLLPVVGIPLPLISYGGSSMVTLLIGLGILMSIQTHKKLLTA